MTADFANLPPDCWRLILSKVNFGSRKQLVWALSGSCKTLHRAVKDCPAKVELCGKWKRRQLLGKNFPVHIVGARWRLGLKMSGISASSKMLLSELDQICPGCLAGEDWHMPAEF